MFKIPLFGKQKLLLAFEYGVILSQVAKEQKLELTPEIMARCEEVILKEFTEKSGDRVALDMVPNLLASIETK
jgi:hypothetical protein